jgi:hypothetical protein
MTNDLTKRRGKNKQKRNCKLLVPTKTLPSAKMVSIKYFDLYYLNYINFNKLT